MSSHHDRTIRLFPEPRVCVSDRGGGNPVQACGGAKVRFVRDAGWMLDDDAGPNSRRFQGGRIEIHVQEHNARMRAQRRRYLLVDSRTDSDQVILRIVEKILEI